MSIEKAIETSSQIGDANTAINAVQIALGVDSGDTAAIFFSGVYGDEDLDIEDAWPSFGHAERAKLLNEYVAFEAEFSRVWA